VSKSRPSNIRLLCPPAKVQETTRHQRILLVTIVGPSLPSAVHSQDSDGDFDRHSTRSDHPRTALHKRLQTRYLLTLLFFKPKLFWFCLTFFLLIVCTLIVLPLISSFVLDVSSSTPTPTPHLPCALAPSLSPPFPPRA